GQVRGDEPDPLQQLGRRRLSAPRGRAHRADGALPAQPRRVDQGAQFRRAGHRRWLRPAARACRAHSPAARPSPLTATFALRRPLWAVLPSPGTSVAGATMNPSTLIGMLASIALLSVVMLFAAEDPALFIDLPSLGIVLVGTLAATFISYPLREVARVFGLLHTVKPAAAPGKGRCDGLATPAARQPLRALAQRACVRGGTGKLADHLPGHDHSAAGDAGG